MSRGDNYYPHMDHPTFLTDGPSTGQPSEPRSGERVESLTSGEWPAPAKLQLRTDILSLPGASRILSERYFGGEDVLYPDSAEELSRSLKLLAQLRDMYSGIMTDDFLLSNDEFASWAPVVPERLIVPK